MKIIKINLIATLVFVVTISLPAQNPIPNPGFENWSSNTPDGWFTIPYSIANPVVPHSSAHSGSFSAKLEVVDVLGEKFYPALSAGSDGLGFSVSQKYDTLYGYYRFDPQSGDKFEISIFMWEGGSQGIQVGTGYFSSSNTAFNWTRLSVPITYEGIGTPDLCLMIIRMNDQQHVGSVLFIDDLEFNANEPEAITVTSPNGGENWQEGSQQNIAWISTNIANVKIEYTTDDGSSWLEIISSTPGSAGSYYWTVPDTPSEQCKVKISDVANSSVIDISDNVFTISSQPSSITVTSPNGGENWLVGTTQEVTWESSNVTDVKIEYTTDIGISWMNIVASTPSNGSYSWIIPNSPSLFCIIRIYDTSDSSINDISDFLFAIRDEAPILFVNPTSLSFGDVMLGDSSTQDLIVKNDGELDLTISNIITSNSVFSAVPLSFIVNPGDSQTVVVKFLPTDTRSYSEKLVISSNAGFDTVSLSGAVPFSLLNLSDTQLEFGNLLINSISQQIFNVYNDASATINLEVTDIT
ncbi:MAG: Ig-like domain-containing protein, partial [Candidatus Kariarchaeaceae archaeon]